MLRPPTCPICSGESLKTLHIFTASQAAAHFVPTARSHLYARLTQNIENLWQRSTCQVVQCRNCSFGYPLPYVAGDQEFYELAYGVPSYPQRRWEYHRALGFLSRIEPSATPRFLELGAGAGDFLKALLKTSIFHPNRIVATEYSTHSIAQLRRLGVNAQLASVSDLAAHPQNRSSFDAICAFQSIEHMANIIAVILALKEMLKPRGVIILSVPHGPAIEFTESHLGCFDMPPNHVGRWYRETFVALAHRAGLQLVAHEIEPRNIWGSLRNAMELRVRGMAALKPRSLVGKVRAIETVGIRRVLSAIVGSVALPPLLPALLSMESGYSQLAVLRTAFQPSPARGQQSANGD